MNCMQHARLPGPWPSCWFCSNSPLSQWCYPTISSSVALSPPAFNHSQHQGLYQWVGSSHQGSKYWTFNFSTSPSNEYSGLISFRIDWSDLFAVQDTLKILLQHHNLKAPVLLQHRNLKAPVLWHSAFFIVQLSHSYPTNGKTTALTRWTFVG